MKAIEAKNIEKEFVKTSYNIRKPFSLSREVKPAVQGLSLEIEEGEFVGFLGPNGAGKTTFLKILSGIIHPTKGSATVFGFVPWERDYKYLSNMSIVMGQKNQLWWDLPAIDSFKLLKEIYALSDKQFNGNLNKMVEVLKMKELLTKRLRNMSLGERMKCELVASFLHDPKVVFLDEPTIGLDVISSRNIRNFLKKINEEKKTTIILTSHYIDDIEELCKRVIIIDHGKKLYDGTFSKLKEKFSRDKTVQIALSGLEQRKSFAHLKIKNKKLDGEYGLVTVKPSDLPETLKEIFTFFAPEDISINDISAEEIIRKIFQKGL